MASLQIKKDLCPADDASRGRSASNNTARTAVAKVRRLSPAPHGPGQIADDVSRGLIALAYSSKEKIFLQMAKTAAMMPKSGCQPVSNIRTRSAGVIRSPGN
jgi:hypothetical protein